MDMPLPNQAPTPTRFTVGLFYRLMTTFLVMRWWLMVT
jgi:hypothetical protein